MFKNLQETISRVFASQKVDNESLILFEDTLIQADIDIETSEKIINELKSSRFSEQVSIEDIQNRVIEIISKILKNAEANYEFKFSGLLNTTKVFEFCLSLKFLNAHLTLSNANWSQGISSQPKRPTSKDSIPAFISSLSNFAS